MDVKWGSLGEVAVVSFGATVGVVLFFALGVRALAGRDAARTAGQDGTALTAAAGACFAVCAGAVLYGLYLIIPQFH
ncbi:hypothetical protein [Actinacidiphila epipremni]|jgi:hypothetical protein|uniref:DUF4190 domain-containing protein n=1 Tax=Actinacidiphila epipremni TaxID=2053013 RepID=A0ABX0ZP44_9ACTN|nr:hypothetical protein [Actinacidiphila epipremni]NJP44337.1 hypothetical protein [Actinacidiphila epipremni]